ncbi:hypothetical protein KEM54_006003 [Ascosphaera aggregata]|nr:hypothetical protein KEM54_006003 [Ascosphaera aggregata]
MLKALNCTSNLPSERKQLGNSIPLVQETLLVTSLADGCEAETLPQVHDISFLCLAASQIFSAGAIAKYQPMSFNSKAGDFGCKVWYVASGEIRTSDGGHAENGAVRELCIGVCLQRPALSYSRGFFMAYQPPYRVECTQGDRRELMAVQSLLAQLVE